MRGTRAGDSEQTYAVISVDALFFRRLANQRRFSRHHDLSQRAVRRVGKGFLLIQGRMNCQSVGSSKFLYVIMGTLQHEVIALTDIAAPVRRGKFLIATDHRN